MAQHLHLDPYLRLGRQAHVQLGRAGSKAGTAANAFSWDGSKPNPARSARHG